MITSSLKSGFIIFLMLFSPISFALSCVAPPTIAERFGKADTVFIANVSSISKDGLQAQFTVEKLYKGEKPAVNEMVIRPMTHWFDKTIFHNNQKYLAFYKQGEELFWGACSKNILLIDEKNAKLLDMIMSLQTVSMTLEGSL